MRKVKNTLMALSLTLASILPGFGQKSATKWIYKPFIWGQSSTDFNNPVFTLTTGHVIKNEKWKGVGVQLWAESNLTKTFKDKSVNGFISPMIHYGKRKYNLNAGPVIDFKKGSVLIDGYKVVGNIWIDKDVGMRGITDFDRNGRFKDLGVYFLYYANHHLDLTAGIRTGDPQKTTDQKVHIGADYKF